MSGASDFAATATAYFRDLQARLCAAFEAFEPVSRFEARSWTKPEGHRLHGGGESRLMRGEVFEKVGVNVSHVWGVLAPEAHGQVAGAQASDGRFVACGISLVAHMVNPYVPAVHLNLRYLCTSRAWFGGGSDLTPTFPFIEDTEVFHGALRRACDGYRPDAYREFKAWCDKYFYLPHRQEPRGVGGIFFDDLASADLQADFGDQLAYYIAIGQLEVTYRPMTFLDNKTGGYSGQVSNALFLATEKTGSPEVKATGTEFQRFVKDVWAHQRPGGEPPTGDELQDMAKKAGMPGPIAQNIKGGGSAVNVKAMDNARLTSAARMVGSVPRALR